MNDDDLVKLKDSGAITQEEFDKQKEIMDKGDAPADQETFSCWYYFKKCMTSNFANFKGRAPLKEYWGFYLFCFLFYLLFSCLVSVSCVNVKTVGLSEDVTTITNIVFCLVFIIPSLAVLVRRLHDANFSGFWLLTFFIPIIVLIMLIHKSDKKENKYGPVPERINNRSENKIIIAAGIFVVLPASLPFLIAPLLAGYTIASNYKANKAIETLQLVSKQIMLNNNENGNFETLTNENIKKLAISLKNPYGPDLVVKGGKDYFRLMMVGVPERACTKIAQTSWGNDYAVGTEKEPLKFTQDPSACSAKNKAIVFTYKPHISAHLPRPTESK